MHKVAFLALILPLLLAPMGPILTAETDSGAETVKDTHEWPNTPLSEFINKWFGGGGRLKDTIQQGMNEAQTEIQEAAGQALNSAQNAVADEISRRISQALQGARNKAEAYIDGAVTKIKTATNNLFLKIKLFFINLFKNNAPTDQN